MKTKEQELALLRLEEMNDLEKKEIAGGSVEEYNPFEKKPIYYLPIWIPLL